MAKRRMSDEEQMLANVFEERVAKLAERHFEYTLPPATAEELVVVLNRKELGAQGKTRVKQVIQLLQKWQAFMSRFGWGAAKTQAERERLIEFASAVPGDALDLDELLSRYWVSPRIVPDRGAPRIAYVVQASKGNEGAIESESGAVMCALQLFVRDELDRVRLCDCGNFYFAKRIDQRYCSTKCRVRFHQSSEEFKAKRRVYLRKLYRQNKQRKVKQQKKGTHGSQKTR